MPSAEVSVGTSPAAMLDGASLGATQTWQYFDVPESEDTATEVVTRHDTFTLDREGVPSIPAPALPAALEAPLPAVPESALLAPQREAELPSLTGSDGLLPLPVTAGGRGRRALVARPAPAVFTPLSHEDNFADVRLGVSLAAPGLAGRPGLLDEAQVRRPGDLAGLSDKLFQLLQPMAGGYSAAAAERRDMTWPQYLSSLMSEPRALAADYITNPASGASFYNPQGLAWDHADLFAGNTYLTAALPKMLAGAVSAQIRLPGRAQWPTVSLEHLADVRHVYITGRETPNQMLKQFNANADAVQHQVEVLSGTLLQHWIEISGQLKHTNYDFGNGLGPLLDVDHIVWNTFLSAVRERYGHDTGLKRTHLGMIQVFLGVNYVYGVNPYEPAKGFTEPSGYQPGPRQYVRDDKVRWVELWVPATQKHLWEAIAEAQKPLVAVRAMPTPSEVPAIAEVTDETLPAEVAVPTPPAERLPRDIPLPAVSPGEAAALARPTEDVHLPPPPGELLAAAGPSTEPVATGPRRLDFFPPGARRYTGRAARIVQAGDEGSLSASESDGDGEDSGPGITVSSRRNSPLRGILPGRFAPGFQSRGSGFEEPDEAWDDDLPLPEISQQATAVLSAHFPRAPATPGPQAREYVDAEDDEEDLRSEDEDEDEAQLPEEPGPVPTPLVDLVRTLRDKEPRRVRRDPDELLRLLDDGSRQSTPGLVTPATESEKVARQATAQDPEETIEWVAEQVTTGATPVTAEADVEAAGDVKSAAKGKAAAEASPPGLAEHGAPGASVEKTDSESEYAREPEDHFERLSGRTPAETVARAWREVPSGFGLPEGPDWWKAAFQLDAATATTFVLERSPDANGDYLTRGGARPPAQIFIRGSDSTRLAQELSSRLAGHNVVVTGVRGNLSRLLRAVTHFTRSRFVAFLGGKKVKSGRGNLAAFLSDVSSITAKEGTGAGESPAGSRRQPRGPRSTRGSPGSRFWLRARARARARMAPAFPDGRIRSLGGLLYQPPRGLTVLRVPNRAVERGLLRDDHLNRIAELQRRGRLRVFEQSAGEGGPMRLDVEPPIVPGAGHEIRRTVVAASELYPPGAARGYALDYDGNIGIGWTPQHAEPNPPWAAPEPVGARAVNVPAWHDSDEGRHRSLSALARVGARSGLQLVVDPGGKAAEFLRRAAEAVRVTPAEDRLVLQRVFAEAMEDDGEGLAGLSADLLAGLLVFDRNVRIVDESGTILPDLNARAVYRSRSTADGATEVVAVSPDQPDPSVRLGAEYLTDTTIGGTGLGMMSEALGIRPAWYEWERYKETPSTADTAALSKSLAGRSPAETVAEAWRRTPSGFTLAEDLAQWQAAQGLGRLEQADTFTLSQSPDANGDYLVRGSRLSIAALAQQVAAQLTAQGRRPPTQLYIHGPDSARLARELSRWLAPHNVAVIGVRGRFSSLLSGKTFTRSRWVAYLNGKSAGTARGDLSWLLGRVTRAQSQPQSQPWAGPSPSPPGSADDDGGAPVIIGVSPVPTDDIVDLPGTSSGARRPSRPGREIAINDIPAGGDDEVILPDISGIPWPPPPDDAWGDEPNRHGRRGGHRWAADPVGRKYSKSAAISSSAGPARRADALVAEQDQPSTTEQEPAVGLALADLSPKEAADQINALLGSRKWNGTDAGLLRGMVLNRVRERTRTQPPGAEAGDQEAQRAAALASVSFRQVVEGYRIAQEHGRRGGPDQMAEWIAEVLLSGSP
jgi:hypothetical protein